MKLRATYCEACQEGGAGNAKVCPKCGQPMKPLNTKKRRKNKNNAEGGYWEGQYYPSKKEMRFAKKLELLKRAGEVDHWQPQYKLDFSEVGIDHTHRVDFYVEWSDGRKELIEIKGGKHMAQKQAYRINRRLIKSFPEVLPENCTYRVIID